MTTTPSGSPLSHPEAPALPEARSVSSRLAPREWMHVHVEIPTMVRVLGLARGNRLLQVGCGRGVALPALARLLEPKRLVGLDLDARVLERARAFLAGSRARAELCHADVRDIPFPDASFDVVIDLGLCYHLHRVADALEEIERVLTSGGTFVYETRLNQFIGRPGRALRRRIPWGAVRHLHKARQMLLWGVRVRS